IGSKFAAREFNQTLGIVKMAELVVSPSETVSDVGVIAGQGIGAVKEVGTVEDMVARFEREYHEAKAALAAKSGYASWQGMAEAAE
ncbi:MAG: hypothetical protein AAFZ11_12810, partial [Pseudomonadota bacterium]